MSRGTEPDWWSVVGGGARTRDNETFPTLNQSMICTYQVNGPPQSQKWSVLATTRLLMNGVERERISPCDIVSLYNNVSCFQFASCNTEPMQQQPASPAHKQYHVTPSLLSLPHEPSAPLIMQCGLDNVKCIGLAETRNMFMLADHWYSETRNILSDRWYLKLEYRISKDNIW